MASIVADRPITMTRPGLFIGPEARFRLTFRAASD